ncbi:MAG: propionyl-CoA synthetase [Rhodospirillales bacterium]
MGRYADMHRRSLEDPEGFWAEAARAVDWIKDYDRVIDREAKPVPRWFPGGELNTAQLCLDRHVEAGRGAQTALIYDSAMTHQKRRYSYEELRDEVALFAGALADQGVTKGDRVIIYMPMVPEAVIAMLGCARIGAIHSVVFGGFAANELATRINDSRAKVIVAASCGLEPGRIVPYKPLVDAAIGMAVHKPDQCIILQRPQHEAEMLDRDIDWDRAMGRAKPHPCVPMASTDPLYVIYTSGTTGQPKGIVRDTGGHAVAMIWSMSNLYDIKPGEVFWAASDVGWVVGHSYIAYAPLMAGCTSILYEGKPVGTPDAGAYWRIIEEHKVASLFTAPTAFRAIRQRDPDGALMQKYDLGSLRSLFLAGERCDPDTLAWAQEKLKVPVVDHWWQTETGWCICGNFLGVEELPVKPGSPTVPGPGWDLRILDIEGKEKPAGEIGSLVAKLPLPPGTFPTLWHAPERFTKAYLETFPGYYETGDAGIIDEDGYVHVMARTDDIINVAGHRLSTGAMEEVLAAHPDVSECAVIGVADKLKGQVPLGFLVVKSGAEAPPDEVVKDVVAMVRDRIGPVAFFKLATVVERLPKTRSGKILRATMRAIADDEPYKVPATIDDPVILEEIETALKSMGYGKGS